ncbi:MAG: hypothetical protein ACI4GY_11155 [Acutalibacteraceae bacterium]
MIFVMSGICGRLDKYRQMLEKLNLKENEDSLFVLGNVIGNRKESIAVLKDMMYRQNIFPVLGKQEYTAKRILPAVSGAKDAESCVSLISDELKTEFADWLKHGGYNILEAFLALDSEGKDSILDYLGEFEPYEEVDAGGKTFVLAHAGIANFEEDKPLESYDESDFVLEKADYSKIYFKDKYLITAHTPTAEIPGAKPGKVFSAKRHLAIECSGNGERIAAVCLDTMKVYYC